MFVLTPCKSFMLTLSNCRRHRQPNKCAVSAVNENAQSPTLASPVPDYDVTQQPMKTLENKHTVLHSLYFDYSKWKQIFSQYIVDQKNVAILETIGEGMLYGFKIIMVTIDCCICRYEYYDIIITCNVCMLA